VCLISMCDMFKKFSCSCCPDSIRMGDSGTSPRYHHNCVGTYIYLPTLRCCCLCRDSYFSQGLARVQEFLDGSAGDSSSCLICLSAISPTDAVWSCQGSCFALYHLNCAQVGLMGVNQDPWC
jgi:hypothetical protein